MRTATTLLLWLTLLSAPAGAGQPPQPPDPAPARPTNVDELIAKVQDANLKVAQEALVALVDLGPAAVPGLTQGLWSDSFTARRRCAYVLGAIGGDARSAAPSLARVMRDDNDAEVRREAARALGSVGAHATIPALTKALKDESGSVRMAAAESLIQLGADADLVLPMLTKALKAARPQERQAAAQLLGQLGPEAAPALLAVQGELVESDAGTAFYLCDTLGRIGPEARNLVPTLKMKVKDDQNAPLFRVPAAAALWCIARDADAATLLRDALDGKKLFRPLPHGVLWRIAPTPETVAALEKQLKSKDVEEVLLAADVLGGRSKDTVPELTKLVAAVAHVLGGGEPPADFNFEKALPQAQQAMAILGRIGPDAKAALEPVTTIAKAKKELGFPAAVALYQIDPKPDNALAIAAFLENKDFRAQAANALRQLRPTGKAVAIELLVGLDSPDEQVKLDAAGALWRVEQNPAALKAIRKLLASPSPRTREQAALELGAEFGAAARPAVPELVKRLFDSHSAVRSVTAEAFGRIGPDAKDAAPALRAVLEGDEPAFVQSAACEALGRIEPTDKKEVIALLKQKLDHPAPIVRAHAALALAHLGDKTGQEEAARGLTHRTHYVRITAAEALWRLNKDGRAVPLLVRALEESNLFGTESDNERYMAARALGRIGAEAKPAVPELLRLIRHRDDLLALTARTALKQIDPTAAAAAGVK